MLLLLTALPALFWDGAADTAGAVRDAGIKQILVPAARLAEWKSVPGISATAADLQGAVKLSPPTVNYRINQASASRAPWLDSNGWRFLRQPEGRFYYEVAGKQSALAAAEAFSYGASAMIHSDAAGLQPLAEMLQFLGGVSGGEAMPAVADIAFVDDGSAESGEVMNLMIRENLLFRIVPSTDRARPDPGVKLTVRLGTPEYPAADAKNPIVVAHAIRVNLTDARRSVRIYGSPVVIARLTASGGRARLHLLNYTSATRVVDGIRVRVLGQYPKHQLAAAGSPELELLDYSVEKDATEFTLPQLKTYAVIDLSR